MGYYAPPALAQKWRLWEDVVLRGAGFEAAGVLRLRDDSLTSAADIAARQAPDAAGRASAIADYRGHFDDATARLTHILTEIATSPRFQTALVWQNRGAWRSGLGPYLAHAPGKRNARQRAREDLICNYWQRYSVKNDSAGFFGPIGWAHIDERIPDIRVTPGSRLVAQQGLFFENWAVRALAKGLTDWNQMRGWARPQLKPYIQMKEGMAFPPSMPPIALTNTESALLSLCDGRRSANAVLEAAMRGNIVRSSAEGLVLLDNLRNRRLLDWEVEIPVSVYPEVSLRGFIGSIEDLTLRRSCQQRLDVLEDCRRDVALVADCPERLDAALDVLDKRFQELAGVSPTRLAGRSYAGRTVMFQDCRRDIEVTLGAPFLRALEPIYLILESCRWLTARAGQMIEERLEDLYRRLLIESREEEVDLATLWFASMPLLYRDGPALMDALEREFQNRWAMVLRAPLMTRRVRYTMEELAPLVSREFPALPAGWSGARYHSPDVLLAAANLEAVQRGDFFLVLGEAHVAINSLRHSCLVAQHPRPAALLSRVDKDFEGPRILPVLPTESPPRLTGRLHPALSRPQDIHVELFHRSVDREKFRVVPSSALSVRRKDRGLVVTVDGVDFRVLDVFSEALMGLVLNRMILLPDADHTPRVTVDRLVIARESWKLTGSDLDFGGIADEADRFLAARAMQRRLGMPAQVFVKAPFEDKPIYVDFDSPLFVNVLAKLARKARANSDDGADLKVTEMLPSISQAWLPDAEGRCYTSEFRLVAFDLIAPK